MQHKTILVIEPDHDNRVLARTALESVGHFVISETSAADALTALRTIPPPNLVLISSNLSQSDAEDFIRTFRASPSHANTPIAQFLGQGDRIFGGVRCTIPVPACSRFIDPSGI